MTKNPEDKWERITDDFYENFRNIGVINYKIFMCGSYGDDYLSILEELKNIIRRESFEFHFAFLESDFKETYKDNFILKLDFLADYSNEIFIVIEQNIGEYMMGIGSILANEEYRKKTTIYILKDSPIANLLTPIFKENDKLFYFNDTADLKSNILEHLRYS